MADSNGALDAVIPLDDVERVDDITRGDFRERFVKTGKPVVIRGLAERLNWPAWSKWTPEYFKEKFGERPVIVNSRTRAGENKHDHYGTRIEMTMREYIDAVMTSDDDLRLGARNTVDLALDVVDDYTFSDLGNGWTTRLLWLFFGSRNSRTPLHYDFGPFHVFHTCFLGKKTFCLFPLDQGRALHQQLLTVTSKVNPHAPPDFTRFPRLRGVKGWRVSIDRGDTLYIPAGAWHDVLYHDASIALTQRFTEDAPSPRMTVAGVLLKAVLNGLLTRLAPSLWARLQERWS